MFNVLLKDAMPLIEKLCPVIFSALGFPVAGSIAMTILNEVFDLQGKPLLDAPHIINEAPEFKFKDAEDRFLAWARQNMPLEVDGEIKFKWS
jgi:hypothetical protein